MLAATMYDFKSLGKRVLESPSDEERMHLKTFLAATTTTTVDENPLISE